MVHSLQGAEEPSLMRPLLRGWLHLGGVVAMITATPFLLAHARSDAQVEWALCYAISVSGMFGVSAAFHRGNWSTTARRRWRRADHLMIFVAIVGSYFAVAGLTMHGAIRVVLLSVIAGAAIAGVAIGQWAIDAPKWVHTVPYLIVGWAAVAVLPQIYRGGGATFFALVLVGGLAYSLGAVAYALKRPRLAPRVFGYHEVFHAATLIGAGCHFGALWVVMR